MATNEHNDDAPPCRIYTKNNGAFHVKDINAWRGQDLGIYANGAWGYNLGQECDVLIPYDEVKHIEFDFAALDEFHAAKVEALRPPADEQEAA